MRQTRTSGSMRGRCKRRVGKILGHRQPKGPATRKASLRYRATSLLYPNTPPPPSRTAALPPPRADHERDRATSLPSPTPPPPRIRPPRIRPRIRPEYASPNTLCTLFLTGGLETPSRP